MRPSQRHYEEGVHVRWLSAADAGPALHGQALEWMTADERARHDRYVLERSRELHRLTRWLVRRTLSRVAPVDPAHWRFVASSRGRPEIAHPVELASLRFSATSTPGLVAVAVSRGRDVGLDAEDASRGRDVLAFAARFFAPAEVAALSALPDGPARQERFFEYWTLKEAYVKARSLGLTLPLDALAFSLGADAVRIAFDPRIADDATAWRFRCWRLGERHRMALAVRRVEADEPIVDAVRELDVPLEP